jgi:hypothetical protein
MINGQCRKNLKGYIQVCLLERKGKAPGKRIPGISIFPPQAHTKLAGEASELYYDHIN